MPTPHERSVGAAMERKAMRAYLRRLLRDDAATPLYVYQDTLKKVLAWVLTRSKRYDRYPGGLGKR